MPRYQTTFTALTDPFTAADKDEAYKQMMALASVWFGVHDDWLPMLADLRLDVQPFEEDNNTR
jgi:hypothetical protein